MKKAILHELIRLALITMLIVIIATTSTLAEDLPRQYTVFSSRETYIMNTTENGDADYISTTDEYQDVLGGKKVLIQKPSSETNLVIIYFGGDSEKADFSSQNHIFQKHWVTPDDMGAYIYTVLYVEPPRNASQHKSVYDGLVADISNRFDGIDDVKVAVIGFSNGGGDTAYMYETLKDNGIDCICLLVDAMTSEAYEVVEYEDADPNIYVFVSAMKSDRRHRIVYLSHKADQRGYIYPGNFMKYSMYHGDMIKKTFKDWSRFIEEFVAM